MNVIGGKSGAKLTTKKRVKFHKSPVKRSPRPRVMAAWNGEKEDPVPRRVMALPGMQKNKSKQQKSVAEELRQQHLLIAEERFRQMQQQQRDLAVAAHADWVRYEKEKAEAEAEAAEKEKEGTKAKKARKKRLVDPENRQRSERGTGRDPVKRRLSNKKAYHKKKELACKMHGLDKGLADLISEDENGKKD